MAAEDDRIVCPSCEKVIRYERPLFCPFCGSKLDPLQGLDIDDGNIKIYRHSAIAPTLMKVGLAWFALLIPVGFIFGKLGVTILCFLFIVVSTILMGLSWWMGKENEKPENS